MSETGEINLKHDVQVRRENKQQFVEDQSMSLDGRRKKEVIALIKEADQLLQNLQIEHQDWILEKKSQFTNYLKEAGISKLEEHDKIPWCSNRIE